MAPIIKCTVQSNHLVFLQMEIAYRMSVTRMISAYDLTPLHVPLVEQKGNDHTNIKGISGSIVVPFFIWMALMALI